MKKISKLFLILLAVVVSIPASISVSAQETQQSNIDTTQSAYWCTEGGSHHITSVGIGWYNSYNEAREAAYGYMREHGSGNYEVQQCDCGLYTAYAKVTSTTSPSTATLPQVTTTTTTASSTAASCQHKFATNPNFNGTHFKICWLCGVTIVEKCSYPCDGIVIKPTCTKQGCTKYFCTECGDTYKTDFTNALSHKWVKTSSTVKKATISSNGHIYQEYTCQNCNDTYSSVEIIPQIATVKLSTSNYVYNGKIFMPSVTVQDAKKKTLIRNTDYTLSYSSGRKNVGKYSVKIIFKGNYSGTKTLYFTIKPTATSISSLTPGSKSITVKYAKKSTQVTGYQIQYSTSSKFSNAKTTTVNSYKTTSKTISKLSGNKKYYVRVRTYKTVSGTKYYSSWSSTKSVNTKK